MEDYALKKFIKSLILSDTISNVEFHPVNFETFKSVINGDATVDLRAIAKLHEWTVSILKQRGDALLFFAKYHPNSPKYWLKNLGRADVLGGKQPRYEIGIDLRNFMSLDPGDQRYPVQMHLGKTVLKEFKKTSKYSTKGIEDLSYMDESRWSSMDPLVIKSLGTYINEKYVQPKLQSMMKDTNIKDMKFTDTTVDFSY